MDADGGSLRRLTTEPGDDVAPSWSRDGRWIYFGSNRTGEHQVWRIPAEGGAAVQVTRNGGTYAEESPDGKFFFYTKARGTTPLWKVPLSEGIVSGPESQVAGAIGYLSFAVRPEGVYFNPGGSIEFVPFAGGAGGVTGGFSPTRWTFRTSSPSVLPQRLAGRRAAATRFG